MSTYRQGITPRRMPDEVPSDLWRCLGSPADVPTEDKYPDRPCTGGLSARRLRSGREARRGEPANSDACLLKARSARLTRANDRSRPVVRRRPLTATNTSGGLLCTPRRFVGYPSSRIVRTCIPSRSQASMSRAIMSRSGSAVSSSAKRVTDAARLVAQSTPRQHCRGLYAVRVPPIALQATRRALVQSKPTNRPRRSRSPAGARSRSV